MNSKILSALFCCLLIGHGCKGTEVGNGFQTRDPDKDSLGGETSAPNPSNEIPTSGQGSAPLYNFSDRLVVACASPFADTILGEFSNELGKLSFKVSLDQNQNPLLTLPETTAAYSIEALPSTDSPYAIKQLSISPQLTCGSSSSELLADGSTRRTVSFSDQTLLSWILVNDTVNSMQITQGTIVRKWIKTAD